MRYARGMHPNSQANLVQNKGATTGRFTRASYRNRYEDVVERLRQAPEKLTKKEERSEL